MGRTILVADDSPTVQKKASGILTGEGLDVVTVSNGVAAVKKLPTVNPLVVLADVSMPGKDGYEVCEHIKSQSGLSHISVLLIFSDSDPYEEGRGARVNADGRIKKPFDRDELVATVSKFVAQSEAALAPKPAARAPEPTPTFEVEPMDEEQEAAAPQAAPDLSAFSGGVAFGVPEEIPSVPADAAVAEPIPEEPIPSTEVPTVAPEAAGEEMAAPAAEISDSGPAVMATEPEVEIAPPEPTPIADEPTLVEEEVQPAETPDEEVGERTMMFRAPADIAQPIFKDEVEAEAPSPEPAMEETAPPPEEVQPAEEAVQPEPAPVAAEPAFPDAKAVAEAAEVTPPGGTPVAIQTLTGFTLSEAAAGHVRFGSPETEVIHEPDRTVAPPPEPEVAAPEPPARTVSEPEVILEEPVAPAAHEPEVTLPEPGAEVPAPEAETMAAETPQTEAAAPPEESVAQAEPAPPPAEAAPPAKTVDEAQVFSIVHKVVLNMSPPALSPQMIEDIVRRIADEIVAGLKSES